VDSLEHRQQFRAAAVDLFITLAQSHSSTWICLHADNLRSFATSFSDIDILAADKADAVADLKKAFGTPLYQFRRSYVTSLFYFWGHIDVYSDLGWRGIRYLDKEAAFRNAINVGGLLVLDPVHQALHSLLASLLWGGFVKQTYRSFIAQTVNQHPDKFDDVVHRLFGSTYSAFIRRCCNTEDWRSLELSTKELRAVMRSSLSWFARTIASVRYFSAEVLLLLTARTPTIAFYGPDGAGKSTAIAALSESARGLFSKVNILHWRPGALTDLGIMIGSRTASAIPCTQPHGKMPHGYVLSLLRCFYYTLDYVFGWLFIVSRARTRNQLVAFDRYYFDFFADPLRYRLKLPEWWLMLLSIFVPKPTLSVILLPPIVVIQRRKLEVGRFELEAQIGRYRALPSLLGPSIIIEGDRAPAEIANIILGHLFDNSSRR
jgi:thymidylate kinase